MTGGGNTGPGAAGMATGCWCQLGPDTKPGLPPVEQERSLFMLEVVSLMSLEGASPRTMLLARRQATSAWRRSSISSVKGRWPMGESMNLAIFFPLELYFFGPSCTQEPPVNTASLAEILSDGGGTLEGPASLPGSLMLPSLFRVSFLVIMGERLNETLGLAEPGARGWR